MKHFKRLIQEQPIYMAFIVLTIVLTIALTMKYFVQMDKIPANASDYEQLEIQVYDIQSPEFLLKEDSNMTAINIDSETITITFENDECKVIAKYDKNFEVLSISKKDKYTFWLIALISSLFLACLYICAVYTILFFVIWLITVIVIEVLEKILKKRRK